MMTHDQYLLLKVAEECDEVGQRVSKQMQFGACQIQPGQELNNAARLRVEVLDLLGRLDDLADAGQLAPICWGDVHQHRQQKSEKWAAMLAKAQLLGQVEP